MFQHLRVGPVASAIFVAVCTFFLNTGVASAVVPSVVASNHQTVVTGLPNGTLRVVANARGDVFYSTPTVSTTDYANMKLMELPAGSTTPVTLLYNLNGPHSVDIDSYGNVYMNNTYNGHVVLVPLLADGTYPTNIDAYTVVGNTKVTPAVPTVTCASLPSATIPHPVSSDCSLPTLGVLTGYFAQTTDMAMDAAGNYYFVDINDNVSAGHYNRIVKYAANGTISILVDNLVTAYNAQITSDAGGNLYYANGTNLYSIAAGSTTPVLRNTSTLNKPTGVTLDAAGNLIVSDSGNSRIVAIPFENGALDFTAQYLVAPYYTQDSVGIDSFGTMYYASASSGANASISRLNTSVYDAGSLAVGTASTSALVYFAFNTSTKVGGFSVSGNGATIAYTGNTCPSTAASAITYAAGQSCSYNASVKPTRVGKVTGYVGLNDGAGDIVTQFALTATGTGSVGNIDPGTINAIGSGYTMPQGVAVDASGNVFIADPGANAVYELVGGSGTPVSVGSGLSGPTGVSVDATGNLFIADAGNQRVVEVPLVGSALSTAGQVTIVDNLQTPIAIANGALNSLYIASAGKLQRYDSRGVPPLQMTYSFNTAYALPGALAVDLAGNVFVADRSAGNVVMFTPTTMYTNDATNYPIAVVVSGLSNPTGLATDTAGNLFVVDNATARTIGIPRTGGTLSEANSFTVGTFSSPYGIAVDSTGNLIVSDMNTSAPAVNRVTRTVGSIDFGTQNLNSTSAAMSAQIISSGTTALSLGSPVFTASGDTAYFSQSGGTCTANQSLASGATCAITSTFTPTVRTTSTETLAINASPTVASSPFSLKLTGKGNFLATTTLAVQAPAGNVSYGQPVTFTAVLTPSQFNVAAAGGTVTFTINGLTQKPVTVANNQAAFTASDLAGGANSISATYSGDDNYQPSTAPTIAVNVNKASTTTILAITVPFLNPPSQTVNGSVKLTATVNASVAGSLSGTVNFISGGTVLASAPAQLVSGTTYQAVVTTTTIPAGTYNIYAEYVGNANYALSDSAAQPLIISGPAILMTADQTSVTATAQSAGTAALTLSSIGGLGNSASAPVALSCSGMPANSRCVFNPGYLTSIMPTTSPTAVSLKFEVNYSDGATTPPIASLRSGRGFFLALLAMPTLFVLRRRGRLSRLLMVAIAVAALPAVFTLSGCGAGAPSTVTPAGTYPVVVKAVVNNSTYPNVSSSLTISLVVK